MPHNKQHIALKNKAKKGLLFLSLLLGVFTFSGAANITSRTSPLTQSELIIKADNLARSAIRYKSAANSLYKTTDSFLNNSRAFITATTVFNITVITKGLHLSRLALSSRQVFFQHYTTIPHAAGPELPVTYGA